MALFVLWIPPLWLLVYALSTEFPALDVDEYFDC